MHAVSSAQCLAGARIHRMRLAAVVVATALAMPGVAYPFSLDILLEMPLERLLQLKVTGRRVAQADGLVTRRLADLTVNGRSHALA